MNTKINDSIANGTDPAFTPVSRWQTNGRGWKALLSSLMLGGALFTANQAHAIDLRDWGRHFTTGSERFQVLAEFGNLAVLDKETQLVWEKIPATVVNTDWEAAKLACMNRGTGGSKGWRLPSVHELNSLVSSAVSTNPRLLGGHPFLGFDGPEKRFFSATRVDGTDFIHFVNFTTGNVNYGAKSADLRAWCVRGANGEHQH